MRKFKQVPNGDDACCSFIAIAQFTHLPNRWRLSLASSPLGTLPVFIAVPGAEAPGWRYVVPVGDFRMKARSAIAYWEGGRVVG